MPPEEEHKIIGMEKCNKTWGYGLFAFAAGH
jgi:hypothetical protein